MAELIQAYCGICNEFAEVEISYITDPIRILISDPEPSHKASGTIKCLGCAPLFGPPYIVIREGRDEAYELMWLWEAKEAGL